jgi:DNA (cytosine-5)-methyltransferase 1
MITHYDLFAGIGGFSLALEEVFPDAAIKHIFCEWESFPSAVLRQHWPDGEFYGDIADLVTHTDTQHKGLERRQQTERPGHHGQPYRAGTDEERQSFTIVTGGFPCQPFSHAGRRKGTADDRYQWPNMFAVIRNTKPEWVIAENVRGLVTWNDGLVLETVCTDLEAEGYEVQPFIIPAVAVGAPHRRDRVWIIGHNPTYTASQRNGGSAGQGRGLHRPDLAADERQGSNIQSESQRRIEQPRDYPDWNRNWQEVAFATCDDSVDDGLSRLVDGVPMSRSKWRQNSLKAYGNGIVPEVAMNIMQAIRASLTDRA